MSACFYIVVEGEDPGYDIFVNGHALASHEAELERLAQALRVTPLLDFFSADVNLMATLLEQGAGNPDWGRRLPAAQWFLPREGLTTVETLLTFLAQHRAYFANRSAQIVQELEQYRTVLRKTAAHNLRWHLAVSWE